MEHSTETEVEHFLAEFKIKMNMWGLQLRSERVKNAVTLTELELTYSGCKAILNELIVEDYSEGPIADVLYKEIPMWVFGKTIKREEVYIKITLGKPGREAVCISFHRAERKMHYPLKR